MRRRRRRDGFYPAPDFRDREAEDMAGVFDIDLDQPEDAGSEDELEEGVRPGVPGGGLGGAPEVTGPGRRRGPGKARRVRGRGDPGVGGASRSWRSRRSRGTARPGAGQRAGRTWPSGVRPLLGLQVPVAPLAPDERSREQPVEGTGTGARGGLARSPGT